MTDADKKAREIVKTLGFAFEKASGRRFIDETVAEDDIATAIREAEQRGRQEAFREAAEILWESGNSLDAAQAIEARGAGEE